MSRKRTRLIAAIVILVLLLALLGAAYLNYRATRRLGIDISFNQAELLRKPDYLFSFAGSEGKHLARPLGVLVSGGRVYVTDGKRGTIDVFTADGDPVATWGKGKLSVPLYIARNPVSGQFYVSDRRLRAVQIFDAAGKFVKEFNPKLPKSELPTFETGGAQWAPVALAFAPDGSLYVTEILNGHRLLLFDPSGAFKKSVGTAGLVKEAAQGEEIFQFPNSVKVNGDEIWVADSNNRRIQVFSKAGEFKRIIVTEGLPRGFDFLPKLKEDEPRWLVVADTLSHDATIWDADKAQRLLNFGERGVLEGQFSYPNDVSVGPTRRIYVADTVNGRIQVWGWLDEQTPIAPPDTPFGWALCLSPLLLLPLLFLLRRRRYFATRDFVEALIGAEELERMVQKRVRWEVTPEDYEALKDLGGDRVNLAELLHEVEHSDSDAQALKDRFELEWTDAVLLSIAQRAKLFCTEDLELRRVARVIEIEVVNHLEFIERHPRGTTKGKTDISEQQ
jgi:DNA-binding beta-propeller fold protein YncE/predicted nucleic acid-binding protein